MELAAFLIGFLAGALWVICLLRRMQVDATLLKRDLKKTLANAESYRQSMYAEMDALHQKIQEYRRYLDEIEVKAWGEQTGDAP